MLSSQLKDMHVGSLRIGKSIAQVERIIVNPHDFTIPAVVCKGSKYKNADYILTVNDIREIRGNLIFINSKDEIVPLEDVIRVRKIENMKYDPINKKVITESGKKLGKVEEYVINSLNFMIEKIHVQRPLLKSLSTSSLIVHKNEIIEVNDEEIIVKDAVVEDSEKVPATASPTV